MAEAESAVDIPETGARDIFQTIMYVLAGTVVIRVINYHYVKLSPSVMTALSAVICGSVLMMLASLSPEISGSLDAMRVMLRSFPEIVMDYMLGFLLFAAAIEVDLGRLGRVRSTVVVLALGGTILSTLFVGTLTWLLLRRMLPLPFEICLLFGTVVSPTDPVAVTSVLNEKPELISTSTRYFVWCESLFNDAVGVVLYYGVLDFVTREDATLSEKLIGVAQVFFRECVVGVLVGLIMGYLAFQLIAAVDEPVLEITITIVLVGLLEVLCLHIEASIPLACICAGLLIGNYGVHFGFSEDGKEGFHQLWKFIDESLNSMLFLLIGLLTVYWRPSLLGWGKYSLLMIAIICISLFSRAMSIIISLYSIVQVEKLLGINLRHTNIRYRAGTVGVLTWGGLRGGLTIALALGVIRNTAPMNTGPGNIIFLMTYTIVLWSLVGQGLLFERACYMIQDASYYYKYSGLELSGLAGAIVAEEEPDAPVSGFSDFSESTSLLNDKNGLYTEEGGKKVDRHARYSSMAGLETLKPLPRLGDVFSKVHQSLFRSGADIPEVHEDEEEKRN